MFRMRECNQLSSISDLLEEVPILCIQVLPLPHPPLQDQEGKWKGKLKPTSGNGTVKPEGARGADVRAERAF